MDTHTILYTPWSENYTLVSSILKYHRQSCCSKICIYSPRMELSECVLAEALSYKLLSIDHSVSAEQNLSESDQSE